MVLVAWPTGGACAAGTSAANAACEAGHTGRMAYYGNLTCRDCGLTFTARWGSVDGADEYRCDQDHVAFVDAKWGTLLALDGGPGSGQTLAELRGLCPHCHTELASGRLPRCPICSSRDHEILISGQG